VNKDKINKTIKINEAKTIKQTPQNKNSSVTDMRIFIVYPLTLKLKEVLRISITHKSEIVCIGPTLPKPRPGIRGCRRACGSKIDRIHHEVHRRTFSTDRSLRQPFKAPRKNTQVLETSD